MTNKTLAQSYLLKATKRLKVLDVLFQEEAYSDVIREAQELLHSHFPGSSTMPARTGLSTTYRQSSGR